jgi:hypothetical protein
MQTEEREDHGARARWHAKEARAHAWRDAGTDRLTHAILAVESRLAQIAQLLTPPGGGHPGDDTDSEAPARG